MLAIVWTQWESNPNDNREIRKLAGRTGVKPAIY